MKAIYYICLLSLFISACKEKEETADPCAHLKNKKFEFELAENPVPGTTVGVLDLGEDIFSTFSITSGNANNHFMITGNRIVVRSNTIDYESKRWYGLNVLANTENCGAINLQVTIKIINLNDKRYAEPILTGLVKFEDQVYGTDPQRHLFTFWQAPNDFQSKRPLVILAPGGGFIEQDMSSLEPFARYLVRCGYTVATVNYVKENGDSPDLLYTKGIMDLKAVVRYFKKEFSVNGNVFRIDTNRIVIAGQGTGGFLAVSHAFLDVNEVPASERWIIDSLGSWEGPYGNPEYCSRVDLCLTFAAGTYSDPSFIEGTDVPLICIHGEGDMQVPYDYSAGPPEVFGSKKIIERADAVNLDNLLILDKESNHFNIMDCSDCFDEAVRYMYRILYQ